MAAIREDEETRSRLRLQAIYLTQNLLALRSFVFPRAWMEMPRRTCAHRGQGHGDTRVSGRNFGFDDSQLKTLGMGKQTGANLDADWARSRFSSFRWNGSTNRQTQAGLVSDPPQMPRLAFRRPLCNSKQRLCRQIGRDGYDRKPAQFARKRAGIMANRVAVLMAAALHR